MNRVIVCGTRTFRDYDFLCSVLDKYITDPANTEIVSGRAVGPDLMGEQYARDHGIKIQMFPANWNKDGRSAGHIRNKRMLDYAMEGEPFVIAFWDGESRGTLNMINLASTYHVKNVIINYKLEKK